MEQCVAECKIHNSDSNTLPYILFFNFRPKKKMGVSGYPTVPNYLPQPLFLKHFSGFPRDFPVRPYWFPSSLCENLNKNLKKILPTVSILKFHVTWNTHFWGALGTAHYLSVSLGGGLKSRGVIWISMLLVGGSPLTLASQQGVTCFNCSNKIITNCPCSLRSLGFYILNSYQAI